MFERIQSVHFIGICGTAMASAAVALMQKGVKVTGSDQNVYPPMSTFLAEQRVEVMSGFSESNLAHNPDLVTCETWQLPGRRLSLSIKLRPLLIPQRAGSVARS